MDEIWKPHFSDERWVFYFFPDAVIIRESSVEGLGRQRIG
jgi:hypothetical protein